MDDEIILDLSSDHSSSDESESDMPPRINILTQEEYAEQYAKSIIRISYIGFCCIFIVYAITSIVLVSQALSSYVIVWLSFILSIFNTLLMIMYLISIIFINKHKSALTNQLTSHYRNILFP